MIEPGKVLLTRIVQMLAKWTAWLLAPCGESARFW
jgi:hypothetical protein